jgi:uncharacterized protein (DUF302 family)
MKNIAALITLTTLIPTSCNTNNMTTNGLIIKESPHNFNTTYRKLKTIISANHNLKILLELDHSVNAASVDLKLNKARIILFGNPKLGTPLMQNSPTISIDLPQKIIVYVGTNSKVNIAYNDPMYIKERHDINDTTDEVLTKINGALNKITNAVIKLD